MEKPNAVDPYMDLDSKAFREGLRFYDAEEAPFRLYGVFREGDRLRRMPEAIAKTVNKGVEVFHRRTAGGRIRFVTDSPYVVLKVEMPYVYLGNRISLSGSAGFDLYNTVDGRNFYGGCFMPPLDVKDGYAYALDNDDGWQEREITIHLTSYSTVARIWIGLHEKAVVKPAPDYLVEKPVVYYGSSITQGASASRPGLNYQNILSRRLRINHVNLGFSGHAYAEETMTDYIKGLSMSAFVMDYDNNAPTPEFLAATHGKMFRAIRQAQPDLPILILPRPMYYLNEEYRQRHEIVYGTYRQALDSGDRNVYFIPGRDLMALVEDDGLVDLHHPTDAGFLSMANAIEPVLRKMLFGK